MKKQHQFFEFKMAAATMLTSGYQTFFHIIDVLLFKVATVPQNLVKIGKKLRERYQFFHIQDGYERHFKEYTYGSTAILRIEF